MFNIFKSRPRCTQCGSTDIFIARSWDFPPNPDSNFITIERQAECVCGHSWPLKALREAK